MEQTQLMYSALLKNQGDQQTSQEHLLVLVPCRSLQRSSKSVDTSAWALCSSLQVLIQFREQKSYASCQISPPSAAQTKAMFLSSRFNLPTSCRTHSPPEEKQVDAFQKTKNINFQTHQMFRRRKTGAGGIRRILWKINTALKNVQT